MIEPVNNVLLQGFTTGKVECFHEFNMLVFTIDSPRVECLLMADPCKLAEIASIMNGSKLNVVLDGSLARFRSLGILVGRLDILVGDKWCVFMV